MLRWLAVDCSSILSNERCWLGSKVNYDKESFSRECTEQEMNRWSGQIAVERKSRQANSSSAPSLSALLWTSIPPQTTMHSTSFRFPLYFRKFSRFRGKILNFTFSNKFFGFHPPKFLMTVFQSSTTNVEFPPLFSLFQYISSPLSRKLLFPHLLNFQISTWFQKIYVFFIYFMCFLFPPSLTLMHFCITQWTPRFTMSWWFGSMDKIRHQLLFCRNQFPAKDRRDLKISENKNSDRH